MKRPLAILFLLFLYATVNAQVPLPDSIKSLMGNIPQDSNYILKLNALASGYLKVNPATSRQIASHVIEKSTKLKYTRGYARGLVVMGNSYWYEGIYEFAQNYYLLAARQYRALHDSVGLAQVYNNMGEVNKRLGELDMALEYLLRSIAMNRKDSTKAMAMYNIGELFITMNRFEQANRYLTQSMVLAKATNNERIIAYNHWSFARLYTEQKKFKEAFAEFALAEALWIKLKETRSLIQTYQDIGAAYRRMGDLDRALQYLHKASDLSKKIDVPDLRITTYLEFYKVDSAAGNFRRAVQYLSRHNALKDSVYDLLKAEQIARVQAIYETEMHEHENQQLRTEKKLKDAQLQGRDVLIIAVSVSLIVVGILAFILFRQRREILRANKDLQAKNGEISFQKNAIESQAEALLILNEELQDLNKTLAGRVDERTKQIFLQNKKLAEYTFVNAHKLRAPVASILGLINLLQQANPSEQKVILDHLKTCSEELDNTLRAINLNLESGIAESKTIW